MARVNLERRAEIGLAKRTRTRAAILHAARARSPRPNGRAGDRRLRTYAALAYCTYKCN